MDDSHMSPESVVVWLIEHAETAMGGESLFPVDPVDSDADSLTDEFVDEIPQLEVRFSVTRTSEYILPFYFVSHAKHPPPLPHRRSVQNSQMEAQK